MLFRPPRLEDAPGLERLINASAAAEVGLIVYQPGDLLRTWQEGEPFDQHVLAVREEPDPEGLLWVEDPRGLDIYFELFLRGEGPGHVALSLIENIEKRAEARARATRGEVGLEVNSGEAGTISVLEERGYRRGKTHLAMVTELDRAPRPRWPEGVRPRPYVEGHEDDLFFRTLREGFGEDWEGPEDRDAWLGKHRSAGYVPELWFFAEGEDGILGAVHSRDTWENDVETGWVRNLAVVAGGRRRGVARALLLESFARLSARGRRRAVLGVEDRNEAAIRLYESVGMQGRGRSTDLFKTVLPPL